MRTVQGLLPWIGVTWRFVLVMVVALVVAGCSQEDSLDSSSAASEASSSSVDVDFGGGDDDPGEATGDADEDAAAVEGEGEGQATSSTSATAPSLSDDDAGEISAIEAEVERVIRRNWEIWIECTTDPDACDPATVLAETEVTTSPLYLESVGVVELWQREGIAYRPVEGRLTDRFVEIRSIEVAPDLESAEVELCDRDDRARFERTAAGDYEMVEGTDIGEDLLLRRMLVVEDGEWKISENELLDRRHVEEGIDPLC